MGKFLKVYDRNHKELDEIYDISPPKYGWMLNDIDTLNTTISMTSEKCTLDNMKFGNHLELVEDKTGIAVWGGILASRNYDDTALKIIGKDYNAFMKQRRMRAKQYPAMQYGALMKAMIDDCQAARPDFPIGITGYNIEAGSLQTTRLVKSTDFLWTKLKEFGDDTNYDYGVGIDRLFNFWLRRGADKPQYTMEWGGDKDNIVVKPLLAEDIESLANSIYAESEVNNATITSLAEDTDSQKAYGLYEGVFSPNSGVSVQSTLDIQTNGELQRCSLPATNTTFTVRDSALCPFDKIEVGDRIILHIIPYFDFKALVRILRMVHDEETQTRDITVGSIIFKRQPATKRLYKG